MSKKAEKKAMNKLVLFDLPFYINVEDSIRDYELEAWHEAYKEGRGSEVYSPYAPHPAKRSPGAIIGKANVVYIPEKLGDIYKVVLPNCPLRFELRFLRRINQTTQSELYGDVFGDRAGRFSFSSVEVKFLLAPIEEKLRENLNFISSLATEAVNKFLEHYRVITKRYYINPLTPQVIGDYSICEENSDGSHSITQLFSATEGQMVFGNMFIPKEKEESLRTVANSFAEPAIAKTLYMEALDKLSLGQWRLAVLEAAILFETWLGLHVRYLFAKQGLEENEIDEKFVRNDKRKTPLSAYKIAQELIREASDSEFDFSQENEFNDWDRDVAQVRNDIVHGKQFSVTRAVAVKALKTVEKAITVIEERTLLSDDQQTHPTLHKWFKENPLEGYSLMSGQTVYVKDDDDDDFMLLKASP